MFNSIKIGFVGLGAMGLGMASRLSKKGFDVVGYDINQESAARLVSEGGRVATSPRQAALNRSVLIVAVATSNQASAVLLDPDTGAAEALERKGTIILCVTAAPEYVVGLKERICAIGRSDIAVLDCPISGGELRAWKGDLSLICSGSRAEIDRVRIILKSMGSQLHLFSGAVGRASSVKMIHQILVGVHILATVEAMGLCAMAGLDPQAVCDSVGASESYSWLFGQRAAHMIDKSKVPASSLMIITKDFVPLFPRPPVRCS